MIILLRSEKKLGDFEDLCKQSKNRKNVLQLEIRLTKPSAEKALLSQIAFALKEKLYVLHHGLQAD